MTDNSRSCPADETLAAYVDGALDHAESERVLTHLTECPRCSEIVSETIAFLADDEPALAESKPAPIPIRPRSHGGMMRYMLPLAAAILLIVLAGLFLQRLRQAPDRAVVRIAEAAPDERILEIRTPGVEWSPLRAEMRGPEQEQSYELLAETARLRELAEKDPSRDHLEALSLAYLVLGDPAMAIDTLQRAGSPERLSETGQSILGAALVAQGRASHDPRLCAEALDVLTPIDDPETLFNQALAQQCLGFDERARATWEQLITIEGPGGWADEARQRLDELDQEDRGAHPTGSDELVDRVLDEILPAWGEAVLRGDGSAQTSHLAEAKELAVRSTDPLLQLAVTRLAETPEPLLTMLARGHRDFGRARDAYRKVDIQEALDHGLDAKDSLTRASSVLAPFASILLASCHYYRVDLDAMDEELDAADPLPESDIAAGRLLWLRGLAQHQKGDLPDALLHYENALTRLERSGAYDSAEALRSRIAGASTDLGQERAAWRIATGVMAKRRALSPREQYMALERVHQLADRGAYRVVAEQASEAALGAARAADRPDMLVAAIAMHSGTSPGKSFDEEIEIALASISDRGVQQRTRTITDLWRASWTAEPHVGETLAHRAISALDPTVQPMLLSLAYAERGLARARMQRYPEATADLRRSLALSDANTSSLATRAEQALARERQREAWSVLIDILSRNGQTEESYLTALDALGGEMSPPDGATRMVFWVGDDSIYGWRHDAAGISSWQPQIRADDLIRLIGEVQDTAARRSSIDQSLLELAKVLPPDIEKGSKIRILAASPLDQVPWAALPVGLDSRLVDYATVALEQPESGTSEPSCDGYAFLAGIGTGSHPNLPDLRFVQAELQEVADAYGDDPAPRCSSVHFAGHATRSGSSLEPLFVVSSTMMTPSALWNEYPATVAVLSGCGTAAGTEYTFSGTASHASELVHEGAQYAMATLWPAMDGEHLELVSEVHRELAAGSHPELALATAQRNAQQRNEAARSWGSWIVIIRS